MQVLHRISNFTEKTLVIELFLTCLMCNCKLNDKGRVLSFCVQKTLKIIKGESRGSNTLKIFRKFF